MTQQAYSGVLASLALALLTGRLLAADAEPIAGVRVLVHWSADTAALGETDTLNVAPDGRFGAVAREIVGDSVWIVVRPLDESRYYTSRVAVSRARLTESLHLVLVPRRWTIRGGRYDATSVSIDLQAALKRIPGYGSFGRLAASRVVGWMPHSFPLPVILRREQGQRISASDSTAFWDAARDLERAIGAELFHPTSDTSQVGRIFPIDVYLDNKIQGAGVTYVTWDRDGQIFEAAIRFRGPTYVRERDIVQHELMHALGFGHTAAWPSTLGARGNTPRVVTAEDVAYAQFLMRVHELEEDPLIVGGIMAR